MGPQDPPPPQLPGVLGRLFPTQLSVPSFDQVMRNVRQAPTVLGLLGGGDLTQIDNSLGSQGTRPKSIKTSPFYDNLSLDQMCAQTQPIKPALAEDAATTWNTVTGTLNGLFAAFGTATTKGITANWSGEAAGAALVGTGKFVESGNNLVDAATAISLKLSNLSRVLGATKQEVQPAHYSTYDNVTSWLGIGGPSKHADEVARTAALNTLNNTYTPGLHETDTLPLFAQPVAPNDAFAPPNTQYGGTGAGGGTPIGGGTGTTGAGGQAATGVGMSSGANAAAQTQQHGQVEQSAPGSGGGVNAPQGGSADAPGSERVAAADASPSAARSWTGLPAGEVGGNAAGGGSGVGGDPGGGILGSPTLGATQATPRTPGVGRIGSAAAARPGMPGMAAPPSAKRDGDKEHRSPSYLVNLDNGNRLIGPLGKASPPVIGVWEDEPGPEEQDNPKA